MGLLITGVVLFVGGMFALRVAVGVTRQERKLSGGRTVQGQVVSFVSRQSKQRGRVVTYTFPVLRFRTAEGAEYEQESQYSWGGSVGQEVQVLYSPDDPTLCRVAGSKMGMIGVAVAWVVTAAFTVVGLALAVNGWQDAF